MQAALTPDDAAFQAEVSDFLRERLDPTLADKVRRGAAISRHEMTHWARTLNERGWAAPSWPVSHGGPGWSLVRRQIFDEACRLAHAPVLTGMNYNMVGPAIIKFGNTEQQQQHLQKTLTCERLWCQGYSEPQAGSDLASLQTRAERDGDEYVVTGQKTWTTGAEDADWIFCLVRTNPNVQQQKGISFLLIDLDSPGVSRRPLYALNGKMLWNEVFFDQVRVPVSNRLGEENRGWTVAKSLLGDERLFVSRVGENKRCLSLVRAALQEQPGCEHLQTKADALQVRLEALEATSLRILSGADEGTQIGAEPSMLKLKGSQLVQAMDELLFEAAAYWVLPGDSGAKDHSIGPRALEYVASGAYHHRGYTIAGGATEVQRNIIAKQVLGLPG
ncbi:MAG: acyl-CoA dehydrogenase family protein [Pseudomonadales bacterium]